MRESHAVDESGNPLRLYHGTADDFSEFRHGHPNKKDAGWLGRGFYFTNSPAMANSYAMLKPGKAENVMPVHLSLKNPFYATMEHKTALKNALMDDPYAAEEFRNKLMEAGHDGVILDYGTKDNVREYVAFDPTQIKSATGNKGTFDPSKPDITKRDGGEVDDDGITAYHGSPHDFEQFDTSKIGTGEGAQAYGHGLYFAQNEDVAKGYRDALAQTRNPIESINDLIGQMSKNSPAGRTRETVKWYMKQDPMLRGHISDDEVVHHISNALNGQNPDGTVSESALESYGKLTDKFGRDHKGHMYEVHINAHPDHFLDWDKPMGEQSEYVKQAFLKAQSKGDPLLEQLLDMSPEGLMIQGMVPSAKGAAAYKTLADDHGSDTKASKILAKAGIKGIRYLDAGSRGQTDEPTHNYVVFDHNHVAVKRKYAQGGVVG
jgi:hypothetical protein